MRHTLLLRFRAPLYGSAPQVIARLVTLRSVDSRRSVDDPAPH